MKNTNQPKNISREIKITTIKIQIYQSSLTMEYIKKDTPMKKN
jgi:hypothetical protein